MGGPEGLPNLSKIGRLSAYGTKNQFHRSQWLSKAAVPLFPNVTGCSFQGVLRPGRPA